MNFSRRAFLKTAGAAAAAFASSAILRGQLLHLVQDEVEDLEMPPMAKRGKFPAMTKDETARLRAWIDQGAMWPWGLSLRASGN